MNAEEIKALSIEMIRGIEQAATKKAQIPLRNLLAIIHRDGGHYVAKHGIEKAAEDAHEVIARLRTDLDSVEQRTREAIRDRLFREASLATVFEVASTYADSGTIAMTTPVKGEL